MGLSHQALGAANNQMDALGKLVENISNVNSIAYKKSDVSFVETLNGQVASVENKDFSQGALKRTDDLLDLAINGQGFFEVELPGGQRGYTRVGRFKQNSDGEVVTQEGYRVIPQIEQTQNATRSVIERKPLVISSGDATNLSVNELGLNLKVVEPKLTIPANFNPDIKEDGSIIGVDSSTGDKSTIGKISVVVFNNPNGLESLGKGYYIPTKDSGAPQDTEVGPNSTTQVKQGYLELSNVSLAKQFMELTKMRDLITAQFKVLKAIDKIYENVNYTIARSA